MSEEDHNHRNFLELYLNGGLLAEDVDDYIDHWHDKPGNKALHEFLGMTQEEYSLWLRDPDTLPHIARARRAGLPLSAVVLSSLEELPIAARSANSIKVDRLRLWLQQKGILS